MALKAPPPSPPCSSFSGRLSPFIRHLVIFSTLLLLASFLRLIVYPRAYDFTTALIALRPAEPHPITIAFSPNVQNGFGAQVLHLIDAAAVKKLAGRRARLCVREARYWNYGCAPHKGWSCYFDATPCPTNLPFRCPQLSHVPASAMWSVRCVMVSSTDSVRRAASVARAMARRHPVSRLAFMRGLARGVWKLNRRTASNVARIAAGVGLTRGRYVAVHIRRGDKRREVPLVPLERYARAITAVRRDGEPVFVASDDGAVLSALRQLLPARVKVVALQALKGRRGHLQVVQNRMWMKRRYGSVAELLAEVEIMRRSRVFVGTFSSNLGRLVHVLRAGDERDSVSLDDRWAPGVAWRTFGQGYCAWPGANVTFCRVMGQTVGRK